MTAPRLFPTGTYVASSWAADVIRVDGPGGLALNPRVRPHGHDDLAAFLLAVLPLETGRLIEAVLESRPWTIKATPESFRGLGFDRGGWSLLPHGPEWTFVLVREGGEARSVATDLLLRCLELYARAVLPVFEGLEASPAGGATREGQAPPWVGTLRIGHRRLKDLLPDDLFVADGR
jgi:hypothetical protein